MVEKTCCKNNYYVISKRNYLEDYGYIISKKIDMTLSGTYLARYPFKNLNKYKLDKYPNSFEKQTLINSIKKKFNFYNNEYSLIIGPGTNGLLQNISKILLRNGGNLLVPYLSFPQMEFSATSFGAETKRVFLKDYDISLENFEKSMDENTKLVYISNPNNPTGLMLENKEIIEFAKKYSNVYIVIDESNIEFSDKDSIIKDEILQNMIIVKSFSKAYGLSNLRIGYLICHKDFEKRYVENITINEFSGISCYYANKSIQSNLYVKNVEKIKKEIEYLRNNLEKMGIETLTTHANTIFTKTVFKNEILEVLEKHDISVVPIIDQEEKLHIRIACQNHKINKMFIKELYKIHNIENYIAQGE